MDNKMVVWIISGLLGIINYLFWGRIKKLENEIEKLESKYSAIEKNYIKRFEEIHSRLADVEKNIIKEIYTVKLSVIKNKEMS